jgi:3-phosphoshikimate 1-carboxyvinyltransferase
LLMLATTCKVLRVQQCRHPLRGEVRVPGDKSISHRAVMLGSIAEGTTRIRNFLAANDCIATMEAVRALGVEVEYTTDEVLVHGRGLHGLREPYRPVECGGSGTTMRLLAGLLAGEPFYSVLTGNAQLSRRPMDRVAVPLRGMGATVLGREEGKHPPLTISGGHLHGITYTPLVASAQVKSSVLLAGLFAEGTTTVIEPTPTRNHTERMLAAMGVALGFSCKGQVSIMPPSKLDALDINVPGDFSSAAFLLVAASIVEGSRLVLPVVGVNPGRIGILHALRRMGGHVVLHNERSEHGEPKADLQVAHRVLNATTIGSEDVPGMIDELLAIAVAATQAAGVTEVRGASELRVKETDRISTTVQELTKMGAEIEALPDGFLVRGPTRLRGAVVNSHGDHRLAMALAVAGLVAEGETTVENTECIEDSFPGFDALLESLVSGQERPL